MNTKDIILVAVGALLLVIALFSKKDKEGEVKKIGGLGLVTSCAFSRRCCGILSVNDWRE